jgi:hypothetical protein
LNLDPTVGREWGEGEGSVWAERVFAVLVKDDGLNAVWEGRVGDETVLGFLEETVVGTGRLRRGKEERGKERKGKGKERGKA